jgi:hypothetical protein
VKFETILFGLAFLTLALLSWPEAQTDDNDFAAGSAIRLTPAPATPKLTVVDIDRALKARPATRTAAISR